ncbi:hypothetical protein MAXJ12_12842 [Mesorhizobium alhagi CCNWXJ12-2]|uniref:Uncharacterized protein n=1 Tax=Mesorhizobium alhagi CCNWXJ12-2 TaxID=1107882 RepID=H0HQY6_9HYPH|nr:hypothetical protein MAXJ12_12842 [Mesorhizobium alhagi CCNWXJ12-2]
MQAINCSDTLTSIIFAVIVMYTIMASGFAMVLQ